MILFGPAAIILLAVSRVTAITEVTESLKQSALIDSLLDGYSTNIRPSKNGSTTAITLSFHLNQIIDVNEKSQILKTSAALMLEWHDDYLMWNSSEKNNVDVVWIPGGKIWMPDTHLLNNAVPENIMESASGAGHKIIKVQSDGTVLWDAPLILHSFCKIDFFFFPYDEQECNLPFGPWLYTVDQVEMRRGLAFMAQEEEFTDGGEWFTKKLEIESKELEEGNVTFSAAIIRLHLYRQPLFYILNVVLPCVMVFILSLLSFNLPADSGEKVTLGLTVMLSLTMFMTLQADRMPPTSSNVPLIGQFYIMTLILLVISICMTCMVLKVFHKGSSHHERVPGWVQTVFLKFLPSLLRMKIYTLKKISSKKEEEVMRSNTTDTYFTSSTSVAMLSYETNTCGNSSTVRENGGGALSGYSVRDPDTAAIVRELKGISSSLKSLLYRTDEIDDEDTIIKQWKEVSLVLDRLCLVVYFMLSLMLVLIIIAQMFQREEEE